MSRPAAAVHRVIKAYDVRGLVGEEIDEQFVADVGGAFARLMRDEGRSAPRQVVIGHDMRASSPSLAAAFADGVVSQGLDVVRIGLASTDQLYFASGLLDCPGAMFTASHNPAAYNGIKLCRAGAKPVGKDTGLSAISDDVIAGVPGYDGPVGKMDDRDVLADYGEFLRSLVDLTAAAPAAGRRRRRQRDGRSHRARGAGTDSVDHGAAAVLRTRRHLSQPRGQPAGPGEPRRPAGTCGLDGRRHRAGLRRRRRPVFCGGRIGASGIAVSGDRPGRRARVEQGDRRHGDPQPDHLTSGARAGRRAGRHARAVPRRPFLHQGADGRHRRDLRRRALRALLLPRLLGRGLRDAGRPARAGRARRAAAAAVGVDGRLSALRSLRRDQLHRRRLARRAWRRC